MTVDIEKQTHEAKSIGILCGTSNEMLGMRQVTEVTAVTAALDTHIAQSPSRGRSQFSLVRQPSRCRLQNTEFIRETACMRLGDKDEALSISAFLVSHRLLCAEPLHDLRRTVRIHATRETEHSMSGGSQYQEVQCV